MTFAGCNVSRVLQSAGVVAPCLQRVQDAVSVGAINAGGQQTAGVLDQLAPMLGEKGVLCEGDGGNESCLACVRALVAEEGLDSGEDRRPQVPKRAHLLLVVEEPLAVMTLADGDALVVRVVGGVSEPGRQSHEGRATRWRGGVEGEVICRDVGLVELACAWCQV